MMDAVPRVSAGRLVIGTSKEARASHGARVLVSVSPWFVSP